MAKREAIHSLIKERLGYDAGQSDQEVRRDWAERTKRVCKPCWELKYCPYGPLVEQSPLLPVTAGSDDDRHYEYLQRCLDTGTVGTIEELTEERRAELSLWLEHDDVLLAQALNQLRRRKYWAEASELDDPVAALGGPLPPIHQYRAPYEQEQLPTLGQLPKELRSEARKAMSELRRKYRKALQDGVLDDRETLEPARAALFKRDIENRPRDLPRSIPAEFAAAACTVFGHICPVFFAAESFTETTAQRRSGRYSIPPATRMRIVRRDNYTCQECGKHLKDDEVEFDHIIPVALGGSSEEHNLRLTCFDCNRDKSSSFSPEAIKDKVRPSKGRRVRRSR